MDANIQTVLHYHQTTKHSRSRYARSLGYMDWQTQPNPFREYKNTKKILLPLCLENKTPPYHLLGTQEILPAPLCTESISQLMQFSMGIAAYKSIGTNTWAVRCNASSGNLHPTESYLILPPLSEQNRKSTICHYAPRNHELELLGEFNTKFWDTLPKHSFLIGISSITWREVWKYGERAFRYTQLDAGHAWQSICISAAMLGWRVTKIDDITDESIARILGLDQKERFFEAENPDMLLIVSPSAITQKAMTHLLEEDLPIKYHGVANKLSPSMHTWDIIPKIEKATSTPPIPKPPMTSKKIIKEPTKESKVVVLQRRSIHIMDKELSKISKKTLFTLLKSVKFSLDGKENNAHLVLMVHRVLDMPQGIYILIRNNKDKPLLKTLMSQGFLWEKTELEDLYCLEKKDCTMVSKAISCSQDIASDGAFTLGMLCRFSDTLQEYGAHQYKELYWECGAIGQQLYLEATSLGLSGTGIGCFLDDMFHNLLRLRDNQYQSLYHFTVGVGFVDSRIMSKPAYSNRKN